MRVSLFAEKDRFVCNILSEGRAELADFVCVTFGSFSSVHSMQIRDLSMGNLSCL